MSPIKMEKIEANIRAVAKYVELFNLNDPAGLPELFAEDCFVEDASSLPGEKSVHNRAELSRYFRDLFQRSKSCRLEITDLHGMGKKVLLLWKRTREWEDKPPEQCHGASLFNFSRAKILSVAEYVKTQSP